MTAKKENTPTTGLNTDIKNRIKKFISLMSSRCLLVFSPFYDTIHIDLLNFVSDNLYKSYPDKFSLSYQNINLNSSVKHIAQNITSDLAACYENKKDNGKIKAKISTKSLNNMNYSLQIQRLKTELCKFKKNVIILDNFEEFISGSNSKFLYSYLSLLESKTVNLFTVFISRKVFGTEKIEKRCRSRLSIDKVFIGDINKAQLKLTAVNQSKLKKNKSKKITLKPADFNEQRNYYYLSQLEKIVLVFLLIEIKQKETPCVFDVHTNIIESYKSTHVSKTIGNFPYKLIEKMIVDMEGKGVVSSKNKTSLSWDKEDTIYLLGLKSVYVDSLGEDIENLPIWVHNFIKLI